MATPTVTGLEGAVRGRVVTRADGEYDDARALFNAMIDKHPAGIAYCVDEQDVAAAIAFARERGLRIAVRGGGHNGAALGSVDDGLVTDLPAIDAVELDPPARIVRARGGAPRSPRDAAP